MAEEKSNEDTGNKEIENPPIQELNEADLDQVSGGLQVPGSYVSDFVIKGAGNLANLDKKVNIGEIPFNRTVKL